jgi:hypothetical protein
MELSRAVSFAQTVLFRAVSNSTKQQLEPLYIVGADELDEGLPDSSRQSSRVAGSIAMVPDGYVTLDGLGSLIRRTCGEENVGRISTLRR